MIILLPNISAAAAAPVFNQPVQVGSLPSFNASEHVDEASGIAASRQRPGVFWTHNDNWGDNYLFAVNESGSILGRYWCQDSAEDNVEDPEDISMGPGPVPGVDYLYWGDTGDNGGNPPFCVKRVQEPRVDPQGANQGFNLENHADYDVDVIWITYPQADPFDPQAPWDSGPDQAHYDCEGFFVDPDAKDIYFITKRTSVGKLYRASYADYWDEASGQPKTSKTGNPGPLQVTWMCNMTWGGNITGADISPDGNLILVKKYNHAYFYQRDGRSITETLAQAPVCEVPQSTNPDYQDEAICFDYRGVNYYTVPERKDVGNNPIYLYERTDNMPPKALFTADPLSGEAPLTVNFNALLSNDPDGEIVSYIWDFESDGTPDSSDSGVSREFLAAGEYRVELTVIDNDGETGYTFKNVIVLNPENDPDDPIDPDNPAEPDDPSNPSDPNTDETAEREIPKEIKVTVFNNILKPGNNQALIRCDLKEQGKLVVTIYDSQGNEIMTLFNGNQTEGSHDFSWKGIDSSGKAVGSGIYIVYMQVGSYSETKKIAVVK
ncbi:MAG: PKD domain-containing protein [bacterium]